MKKSLAMGLAVVFVLVLAGLSLAETVNGKIDLKVGDEVYVCGCGEGCPCMTMSRTVGKCTCGKDLVKAGVTKVSADTATVMVNGKEQAYKTTGKYACGCGAGCNCDTISQSPGKCACGKPLVPVNAAKADAPAKQ